MVFFNWLCIFDFVLKDLNNIYMIVLIFVFKDWFFFIFNKVIFKILDLVFFVEKIRYVVFFYILYVYCLF